MKGSNTSVGPDNEAESAAGAQQDAVAATNPGALRETPATTNNLEEEKLVLPQEEEAASQPENRATANLLENEQFVLLQEEEDSNPTLGRLLGFDWTMKTPEVINPQHGSNEEDLQARPSTVHVDDQTVVSEVTLRPVSTLFRGPLYHQPPADQLDIPDEEIANLFANTNRATTASGENSNAPLDNMKTGNSNGEEPLNSNHTCESPENCRICIIETKDDRARELALEEPIIKTSRELALEESIIKTPVSPGHWVEIEQENGSTHICESPENGKICTRKAQEHRANALALEESVMKTASLSSTAVHSPDLDQPNEQLFQHDDVRRNLAPLPAAHSVAARLVRMGGGVARNAEQPGAYSTGPGGGFLRRSSFLSSHVGIQHEEDLEAPPLPRTRGNDDTMRSSILSPQATAVEASEELAQATQVDPGEQQAHMEATEKWYRRTLCGIMVLPLLVILVVVLGLILSRKEEAVEPELEEPDMVIIPTSAPTAVLDLFPTSSQESINTKDTPQEQAYGWLANHPNITNLPEWKIRQMFAMATFYYAMEGPRWPENTRSSWLDYTVDECFWITTPLELMSFLSVEYAHNDDYDLRQCNEAGQIQTIWLMHLQLSNVQVSIPQELALLPSLRVFCLMSSGFNGLLSDISAPELAELSSLEVFNIVGNSLSSTIPTEIARFSSLRILILSDNHLTGTIPTELGMLSNVIQVSLSVNSLSGNIPSEMGLWTSMTHLDLDYNALSETIPTEVGRVTLMERFTVQHNSMTGPIPSELGLLASVQKIRMEMNYFSGGIPNELSMLTHVDEFYLEDNAISGTIPSVLWRLSSLKHMKFGRNSLSGLIPSQLGLLSSVTWLMLNGNSLSGPIPTQLGMISTLGWLFLSGNSLSGPIPTELGMPSCLLGLYLSQKSLSGHIPSELGMSSCLWELTLSHSSFSGQIPSDLGMLPGIAFLKLEGNTLSGPIPSQLGLLQDAFLEKIYMHHNSLTGPIPSELGLLQVASLEQKHFLTELYMHNNSLTGPIPIEVIALLPQLALGYSFGGANSTLSIPSEIGRLASSTDTLDLSGMSLSGAIPSELGLLRNLTRLDLHDNKLSGSIPSELGLLTSLTSLILNQSALTGTIASELGQMTSLSNLWFHNNQLNGTIPAQLGLATNITSLSLHTNSLTGPIPSELRMMTAMVDFALHQNILTGPIPSMLGMLTNLELLLLENNTLTGAIPSELGLLTSVTTLHMNQNSLSGSIPSVLGSMTNLRQLGMEGNALTGAIPTGFDALAGSLETLTLANNSLSGTIPESLCSLGFLKSKLLQGLSFDCDDLLLCGCWWCPCSAGSNSSNAEDSQFLSVWASMINQSP